METKKPLANPKSCLLQRYEEATGSMTESFYPLNCIQFTMEKLSKMIQLLIYQYILTHK